MKKEDKPKRNVLEFKDFIKVEVHKEVEAKKDFQAPGHHTIEASPLYATNDPDMFKAAGIELAKAVKPVSESELPSFESFMNEQFIQEVEATLVKSIFEGLNNTNFFTKDEKSLLESACKDIDFNSINESLLDSIKKGIENVKTAAKDLKGQAIEKVSQLVSSAKDFANWIADIFSKAYDKIIGFFKKKYEPAKKEVLAKIKSGDIKLDVGKAKTEVKDLSSTVTFWIKSFPTLTVNSIKGTFSKKLVEESFMSGEGDMILELSTFNSKEINALLESEEIASPELDQKGPFAFINKVEHILHKIPPFSILHKIKVLIEKGVEYLLNGLSKITKELGGPGAFEFILIPIILSSIVEYNVHHLTDHFIEKAMEEMFKGEWALRIIPGATSILHTLGVVSMVIIVKEILSELGSGEADANADNPGE